MVCVYAINNMDSQFPFWIRYYFGPIMIQLIEQLCNDKFGIILGKLLTPHNRNRGERVVRLLPEIPGIMPSCQSLAVSKSIERRLTEVWTPQASMRSPFIMVMDFAVMLLFWSHPHTCKQPFTHILLSINKCICILM